MTAIEVRRDSRAVKKPKPFSSNIFRIFDPKTLKFKQAELQSMLVGLSDNITAHYCSLDKNFKKLRPGKARIYLGLLDLSFKDELVIKKNNTFRFSLFDPENKIVSNMPRQGRRRYSTRNKKTLLSQKTKAKRGFFKQVRFCLCR